MSTPQHQLPEDTLYVKDNEYVAVRQEDGRIRVFLISGLFSTHKLLPMVAVPEQDTPLGFVDSTTVGASTPPNVVYLATIFDKVFDSFESAYSAIQSSKLGSSVSNVCIDVARITKKNAVIYRPQ